MARPPVMLAYPVRLEAAEEGGFVVNFPDFSEGWSQGDGREEALAQAADPLETMVANYMAEGWDLPDPSPAWGRPLVRLGRSLPPKPSYTGRCAGRGLTRRRWPAASASLQKDVDRLFSIHHKTRLEQIEAALAVLGCRLVVSVEPV